MRRSRARTTLLGVCALGVLLWGGVTQLGVDPNSLIAQLILLLLALLLTIAVAGVFVILLGLLRRRRRETK